ncbi:glucoside xylosyltransferase 2 [Anopheles stephensi]|uniref:UDP-D-xylose:beta-D-glucoside alpha-1,3-D-xylosyltransferase n=1 Tax=Anopheles stephensi TaxID=30069 RepID=A0A182YII6_ANOST|nr:glucoside xylosyltransferase 2 [Anopheles stephensi]
MRTFRYLALLAAASFLLLLYYIYRVGDRPNFTEQVTADRFPNEQTKAALSRKSYAGSSNGTEISVVVVACNERHNEALNMIKSAIMFNRNQSPLRFVVIAEEKLKLNFMEKLNDWQEVTDRIFTYEIHSLTFPRANKDEWRKLFKPCAAQRLFLPSLLQHLDAVLYVDSDTVFLSPVQEIWAKFQNFNASQFAGMAPEHEDTNAGWYNRFARHPYYGELGVNSGVMLMNLTRMRDFRWEEHILPIYREYRLQLVWGDQDILNVLFHYNPDRLYIFPCDWNYRADHCMYMSVCDAPDGVKIIHGNRGYFHSRAQPIFNLIYSTIEEYTFRTDVYGNFIRTIEESLVLPSNSNCDKLLDKFLLDPRKHFKENQYDEVT